MKKNIIGAAFGLGLMLVAVMPAFAAESCGNGTTGPDSWNVCARISARLNRVTVGNNGTVYQDIKTASNTGGNKSNNNTVGTGVLNSVNSGSAAITGTKSVKLNTVDALVDQTGGTTCPTCNTEVTGLNSVTGPDSKNIIVSADIKAASVDVTNYGTVTQIIRSRANSGGNEANHNTVAGGITTGGASVTENVETNLNNTIITVIQ